MPVVVASFKQFFFFNSTIHIKCPLVCKLWQIIPAKKKKKVSTLCSEMSTTKPNANPLFVHWMAANTLLVGDVIWSDFVVCFYVFFCWTIRLNKLLISKSLPLFLIYFFSPVIYTRHVITRGRDFRSMHAAPTLGLRLNEFCHLNISSVGWFKKKKNCWRCSHNVKIKHLFILNCQ